MVKERTLNFVNKKTSDNLKWKPVGISNKKKKVLQQLEQWSNNIRMMLRYIQKYEHRSVGRAWRKKIIQVCFGKIYGNTHTHTHTHTHTQMKSYMYNTYAYTNPYT